MPDASPQILELPALDGAEITLELPAAASGDYVMQPWVFAETQAARAIKFKPDPITITFSDGTKKPVAAAPLAPVAPSPVPPTINWATTAGVVLVGNVSFGSVLGGLWFALRRRGLPKKGLSL